MDEEVIGKVVQNLQQEVANWQLRALLAEAKLETEMQRQVQSAVDETMTEAPEPTEA